MTPTAYREGLSRLSPSTWAYLQPDGTMGLSNAGVVAGSGEALLVDTFWDLGHTRRLLGAIDAEVRRPIRRLVNTHANGDHCWGNQLVVGAQIIGHTTCPGEMLRYPPATMQRIKTGLATTPSLRLLQQQLARFDFEGIIVTPPTRLFDRALTVDVNGVRVDLVYLGPAHTNSDIVAVLPGEGVVFAGDLVFRGCTPFGWEGSFSRWIAALDHLASLDAHTFIPGHGPPCGPEGIREMREYLLYVQEESRKRFDAGVPVERAAEDIDLGPYGRWGEKERIVYNVARAYREFSGLPPDADYDFFALADAAANLAEKWATAPEQHART